MSAARDDEVVVEGEKGGAAAASGLDDGAFADPALAEELLDDGGDGAGLEERGAGEVDAGDGLKGADAFEDEVAVDVTGELAGGDLHVGGAAGGLPDGLLLHGVDGSGGDRS